MTSDVLTNLYLTASFVFVVVVVVVVVLFCFLCNHKKYNNYAVTAV